MPVRYLGYDYLQMALDAKKRRLNESLLVYPQILPSLALTDLGSFQYRELWKRGKIVLKVSKCVKLVKIL